MSDDSKFVQNQDSLRTSTAPAEPAAPAAPAEPAEPAAPAAPAGEPGKQLSESCIRYRRRVERETGLPWDQIDHKRGRKRMDGQPCRNVLRSRIVYQAYREHLMECRKESCTICDFK